MERREVIRRRTISFVIQAIAMIAGLAGMLVLLFLITQQARLAEDQDRPGLVRMAWMTAGLAGFTLIILLWTVMRYYGFRRMMAKPVTKLTYVDAWAEAGRRFQVEQTESPDGGECDSSGRS